MASWNARPALTPDSGTVETITSSMPVEHAGHGLLNPNNIPNICTQTLSPPPSVPHRNSMHSRSLSNPFPFNLFGRRKATERDNPRDPFLDVTVEDYAVQQQGPSRPASPDIYPNVSAAVTEQSTIRKCMACEHSNSFPSGRRGFRCGKCNTMNDLEPYEASQFLQIPSADEKVKICSFVPGRGL